jgi:hypothetical protein
VPHTWRHVFMLHIIHITNKGSHMNTIEKYLTYRKTKKLRLMTKIPQLKTNNDIIDKYETPQMASTYLHRTSHNIKNDISISICGTHAQLSLCHTHDIHDVFHCALLNITDDNFHTAFNTLHFVYVCCCTLLVVRCHKKTNLSHTK